LAKRNCQNKQLISVFLSLLICTLFFAFPQGNAYAMPFNAAVNYATGTGTVPYSVAVGDFNRDGNPDLATANGNSDNVSVLLGKGNGTFDDAVHYATGTGTGPCSVTVGDFNRDGKPDLATANGNSDNVSVLLGAGDGTFNLQATNYAVGDLPCCVAVGDFNRDGNPDLATANHNSHRVSVLLGNGDSTFNAAVNYAVGTSPVSVAVGDFNRDGKPDLATANSSWGSYNVSILLGNGDGTFNGAVNYVVGQSPYCVAVGDFNRDGNPDLATANNNSGNVSVLLGVGNGTFNAADNYFVGTSPRSVAVGDFDRDGNPDLVATNDGEGGRVSILLGKDDGGGTFNTPAVNYAVDILPYCVAVGDFDRDGDPDLAVANAGTANVSILLNTATPESLSFNAAANYATGTGPFSTIVGDFNRDGKPDLATANSSFGSDNVSILLGDVGGTFNTPLNYAVGRSPVSIAAGDFDRDGDPDLVTANVNDDNVSILLGDGNGAFDDAVNYAVGDLPFCVAVGDFNRDGKPDLATANSGSVNYSILLGDGNGAFSAAHYAARGVPYSVAVGDFNKDGKPDLAVTDCVVNGSVYVLLGVGDGTFNLQAVDYPVGTEPVYIAVGDFNKDGNPDLATANKNSANTSVLLGNGDGTFDDAVNYATGLFPFSVAVGDLNRDGNPDLAVVNYNSNNVSVLPGNGDGTFRAADDYTVGTNPRSVSVGDFDRDGKPDLAVANNDDNNVSILLNTSAPLPPPTVTGVNPASGIQEQTLDVTITGTDFNEATSVSFGAGVAVNNFTFDSATQISANITIAGDAATGARDVSVTTPWGTGTLTGGFTVNQAPPTVTGVNPTSGIQGETLDVTITGTHFSGVTSVRFGGLGSYVTANNFTEDSDTQITANVTILSYASPGTRDVTVTTAAGTDTLSDGFTVNRAGEQTQNINTATGTGIATFTTSNGAVTGLTAATSTPCGPAPGFSFPHGFFSFSITNITPGSTVTITITLPYNTPVGTQYWKCQNGIWVNCTSLMGSNDGDNVLTLTLTDGGLGDADGAANGTIVDPGGPAIAASAAPAIPAATRASPPMPTPRPLKPAQMSVQYLSVSPQQTTAGQPVTITTNVVNTGYEAGNYNVTLKINGQVEQSRMVSVGPQGTQPVKFTITKTQPGTYTVSIDAQKRSFTVTGAGSKPSAGIGEGLLFATATAVIAILVVLLIVVARRRFQGY
jgi:hypothetical protein